MNKNIYHYFYKMFELFYKTLEITIYYNNYKYNAKLLKRFFFEMQTIILEKKYVVEITIARRSQY